RPPSRRTAAPNECSSHLHVRRVARGSHGAARAVSRSNDCYGAASDTGLTRLGLLKATADRSPDATLPKNPIVRERPCPGARYRRVTDGLQSQSTSNDHLAFPAGGQLKRTENARLP